MSAAVSVVVPYYRAQADLDRLTAALAAQRGLTGGLQLVVADDGSPVPPRVDPGLPFDVVTVRQPDRGFRASAARALGAEAADGDVLAFLDGDMLPEPGYLAAALAAVAEAPRDAAVVGRRRHLAEAWLERAWAEGWRPGHEVPADARLAEPAWLREGYRATDDLRRADSTGYRYVISAVLTVAREVYEDAGGFDPAFVGYGGEDWELAHRLWRVGAALRHAPDAVAWQAGADFGGRGDAAEAVGHEAIGKEDGCAHEGVAGQEAEDKEDADNQEGDDDDDLDESEPVLKFAEGAHVQQIDEAEDGDADGGGDPGRDVEPRADEARGAGDFGAEDGDGGAPVDPPLGKARPAADAVFGVFGKGAGGGDNGAHLAQHLHHQNGQKASDDVGEEHGGAGGGNADAGAQEKSGTDGGA